MNISIEEAARSDESVLVVGGDARARVAVAAAIHARSARSTRPFRSIVCGPTGNPEAETRFERELLGFAKAAFIGTTTGRSGALEEANGGALFIDDALAISLALQWALMSPLEHGTTRRIGEFKPTIVDVRVLFGTGGDLAVARQTGQFRADLYDKITRLVVVAPTAAVS